MPTSDAFSLSPAASQTIGLEGDDPMTLQLLPLDLLREVLQYCSGVELASLSVASKDLRNTALNDQLWRQASAKAFTWKPELACVTRQVASMPALWLQQWTASWGPCLLPGVNLLRPPDGVERLISRTGKRLRLLQMETRHAEVYFQRECFAICEALLHAWQEGQPQLEPHLIERIRHQSRKYLRHMLVAIRVLFTLVSDAIALRLCALLPQVARHLHGTEAALESMWAASAAASDAVCNWADAIARADPWLASSEECGLPLVLAAQATFRSQVLLAYPVHQLLATPLAAAAMLHSTPAAKPQWISDAQQVVRTHRAPQDELHRYWFNRESADSAGRFAAAYHTLPHVAMRSANASAAVVRKLHTRKLQTRND